VTGFDDSKFISKDHRICIVLAAALLEIGLHISSICLALPCWMVRMVCIFLHSTRAFLRTPSCTFMEQEPNETVPSKN
jgi:hypothetical protein